MIFLNDEHYARLVDALVAVKPSAWSGRITADEIRIALCEGGDIVPASLRDDVIRSAIEDIENVPTNLFA